MGVKVASGIGGARLSRDGRMVTTELPTDEENVFLAVWTSHRGQGDYRCAAMGVRHLPREAGDRFSATLSSPMDTKFLGNYAKGTRFSRGNLLAVHAELLDMVREFVAGDPETFDGVLAATPRRD